MTAAFDVEKEVDLRGPAIIITGDLSRGFTGHGVFQTVDESLEWFTKEKQEKFGSGNIVILANVMNILFGEYVLVGMTGLSNPYYFMGPFDTFDRAVEAAAIITQKSQEPIYLDIMKVSKGEEPNVEL